MPIRGSRRPNVVPITAPSFSTPPRPYLYRKIAYAFIALTVFIVIAVLWLSSMRAEVRVRVRRESVKIDHVIEISKTPRAGQLAGRVSQGELKLDKEFSIRGTVASTTVPVVTTTPSTVPVVTTAPVAVTTTDGIARGVVRIVNKYSKPQTLVKTTRLLTTDGKLYRLNKTISVPAGGEVSVDVYSDKVGTEFAISPTTFIIPGLYIDLQKFIYAVSDTAFAFNTVTTTPPPTPAPVVRPPTTTPGTRPVVRNTTPNTDEVTDALREVRNQALDQLKKNLAANIGDIAAFEPVYFVNEEPKVLPGSTAESFIASVKVTITAVYYPKDDMLVLVRTKLKEKVPSDRELIPFDNQAITYSVESVDAKNETATIRVKADADYRLTPSTPAFQTSALAGKSKEEVTNTIKAIEGVERVEVITHPGWLSKLPSLQDHVEVFIE